MLQPEHLPRIGSLQILVLQQLHDVAKWHTVDEIFEAVKRNPRSPPNLTRPRIASALYGLRIREYLYAAKTGSHEKSPLVYSSFQHDLPRKPEWSTAPIPRPKGGPKRGGDDDG